MNSEQPCNCHDCQARRGEQPMPSIAVIPDKLLSEGKLLIGANGEEYKEVALSFAMRLKEKYPDLAVEVFDFKEPPVDL